ncbi:MAG: hypothetical protein R8M46_04660 [Ghiorsea sp.]
MTQVWIGKGVGGTCAGATITGAMHTYSDDLVKGCQKFSVMALEARELDEIRLYNSSCIFFATSSIEAKLNEWISLSKVVFSDDSEVWLEIERRQRRLSLKEKWNLVAPIRNGVMWASGEEPFQSFETLISLRNEFVHYKGELLGKDEAPNKRIARLMETLEMQSPSKFIEDDCSSWSSDLLNSNNLGEWVYSVVKPF